MDSSRDTSKRQEARNKGPQDIEALIAEAIMERPTPLEIKGRRLYLYPPSLGKSILTANIMRAMNVNQALLAASPVAETLRLSSRYPEEVSRLCAYATLNGRQECCDYDRVEELCDFFQCLDTETRATMLGLVLNQDHTQDIIKYYGIDQELRTMQRVQRMKDREDGSLSFCGRSLWGTTIDAACERYGWSVEYVVWGVSYTTLQLLQADQVKTVYLSAEERKRIHVVRPTDQVLDANDMSAEEVKRALGLE